MLIQPKPNANCNAHELKMIIYIKLELIKKLFTNQKQQQG